MVAYSPLIVHICDPAGECVRVNYPLRRIDNIVELDSSGVLDFIEEVQGADDRLNERGSYAVPNRHPPQEDE